jgi:hypothetical protein
MIIVAASALVKPPQAISHAALSLVRTARVAF